MGRPAGTKNIMRTPEEKEAIVIEALENGPNATFQKYGISESLLHKWIKKYDEHGIEGLNSQTGKHGNKHGNGLNGLHVKKNKTREEELELENGKPINSEIFETLSSPFSKTDKIRVLVVSPSILNRLAMSSI